MANISTASGYAVFSAQNPETLKLLTQAADTMKDNVSYPTDFKWVDAHSNRTQTRQRVFFVGFGCWTFSNIIHALPAHIADQDIPELTSEPWSILWDFSDMEPSERFCGNFILKVEHMAHTPIEESQVTAQQEEIYDRSQEGHSLLRYPDLH